jgi:long-chain acyl-CoA synthetase
VGLISENRKEWLLADLGLLAVGAADVPRGNDTMPAELVYILKTVEAKTAIFENTAQLKKVLAHASEVKDLKTWILFDEPASDAAESLEDLQKALPAGCKLMTFSQVLEAGKASIDTHREMLIERVEDAKPEDLATIIFTSGTTGEPKGVMINHWNFLVQALFIDNKIAIAPGDTWLCVLPVWHSFERVMQYISIANGTALAYSKPLGPILLADLAKVKPTWMASVPRIWESLQAGIYKSLKAKGGASWALFRFFVAVGGAYKHQEALLRGLMPTFRAPQPDHRFHHRIYSLAAASAASCPGQPAGIPQDPRPPGRTIRSRNIRRRRPAGLHRQVFLRRGNSVAGRLRTHRNLTGNLGAHPMEARAGNHRFSAALYRSSGP